jgi:hypothetical protein
MGNVKTYVEAAEVVAEAESIAKIAASEEKPTVPASNAFEERTNRAWNAKGQLD